MKQDERHHTSDDFFVGIDLATRQHQVVVLDAQGCRLTSFKVPHSGVVARIVTGPHEAHRQDPHLPIRYDTGRPSSVIRLRIAQPRTTSLPCPVGLRARRPSPMMDVYRKNVFSTRL